MKKLLLSAIVGIVASFYSQAQVKIGDNPATINSNSLLELESSTKGLLAPRVALVSLTNPSPLTAPIPAGMLVYNNGSALPVGFYFWNGTGWLAIRTSANVRDNFVLVKSTADLPAPVGGIITLAANTVYEINGTINLSSRINLNNAWLRGVDAVNDKLVYTPTSGELFTGANGGSIKSLTLSAPNSGSQLFNINAAGANRNLIMENLYINGCNNVGTIAGFGGTVFMQTVGYFTNTNGITFSNDTNVVLLNTLWDKGNFNTYERFTGNFAFILKTGGAMQVLAANSATAINVSGVTNLTAGEMKNVMFIGSGTYKTGTFSNRWEVESNGLQTEKDDVAMANLYISSSATTNVSVVNTPVKIAGTTATSSAFRVSMPVNNRLTYTGKKTRRFQAICSLTMTASGLNKNYTFYLAKNGTVLVDSRQLLRLPLSVDRGSITLSTTVDLSTNDYVEVWAANNSDNTSFVIETMNLAIR